MKRNLTAALVGCLLSGATGFAQERCGSANDYVVRVRERLEPGTSATALQESLQLLKRATDLCAGMGDAWYFRSLVESRLGWNSRAQLSRRKAEIFESESLRSGLDPFKTPNHFEQDAPSPQVRQKWALVVGVGRFQEPKIPGLAFTSKDARDFAAALLDDNAGRFGPDNVRLLIDDDATTVRIKAELNWLARNAAPEDLVVIYFSSHGSPRELDTAGVSYVVTYDTHIGNPDQLYATALPMVEIADAVRMRVRAQRVVLFLDTCYSGYAVGDALRSRSLGGQGLGVSSETLQRLTQGRGRVIITSSRADERSWESDGLRNGLFTYYLVQALRLDGGLTSIDGVFNHLKERVLHHAVREAGVAQTPVLSKSAQGGEIIIGIPPQSTLSSPSG